MKKLFTISEAAKVLAMSPDSLYMRVWRKQISTVRLGRAHRIRQDVLEDLVENGFASGDALSDTKTA